MFSRLWTNLVILASLAVLGFVGWTFYAEYHQLSVRTQRLVDLKRIGDEEGPCAGLEAARSLEPVDDFDLQRAVELRRKVYAAGVVGQEDGRGREALLEADSEGLVDRTLCEQIKLVRELGEVHPVLELLRFTRQGGDACEDPAELDSVLAALSSHRQVMLHSLMEQVEQLGCLPAWLASKIGTQVFETLESEPDAMDDLDVLRVAKFLEGWAPVRAAQFACWVQATGQASRLGTTLGCTPYHQRQVLPRYRYAKPIPALAGADAGEAGGEVYLLREEGDRCLVRPAGEPPRAFTASCGALTFLSDVQVAVLIESIAYGLARASLIAGVASYDGATGSVRVTREEPELRSWYGYNRDGAPLGLTQEVRLADVASMVGEELPEQPVRSYCTEVGARYCYDVDWTQTVGELDGNAVVFLSRPMRIFLQEARLPADVTVALMAEAFGGPVPAGASLRSYALGNGGYLFAAVAPGSVELRWRLSGDAAWRSQSFGTREGGNAPPAARLLAAFDLRRDGRPELLLQRIDRELRHGDLQDANDSIVLLALDDGGLRFETLNTLTIHEY
jgi:hypothetical protein